FIGAIRFCYSIADRDGRSGSELELNVELHATRRLGGYGFSKKRGRHRSDVSHVVGVVQNVERVERNGENSGFFFRLRQGEIVREVEIQVDQTRTSHGIAP